MTPGCKHQAGGRNSHLCLERRPVARQLSMAPKPSNPEDPEAVPARMRDCWPGVTLCCADGNIPRQTAWQVQLLLKVRNPSTQPRPQTIYSQYLWCANVTCLWSTWTTMHYTASSKGLHACVYIYICICKEMSIETPLPKHCV